MIIRNLDANGDWQMGKGKANFVNGDAAIALDIKTQILSWKNDCFFAPGAGIDWYNRLGSKNQRELLQDELRRIILQTDGVTGIIDMSLTLDRTTRNFVAEYSIITVNNDEFLDSLTLGGAINA